MSVQINIRVDERTVEALDHLAAEEGRTRAEVVRDALVRRLAEARRARIDLTYGQAYAEQPETPDELRRAEQAAARLTAEEPWEPWW
ncbi:MAG: ribbon-helix-helix protein, CopG family [Actinomycetota bacterium]|nr:ribbon-helix-helix protein, CopG family [Actinomycetota bacterium]